MNFQSSLEALVGAFFIFYLGCVAIGRPDIPMKVVTELRVKALAGTSVSWNCPSAFDRAACRRYAPNHYR